MVSWIHLSPPSCDENGRDFDGTIIILGDFDSIICLLAIERSQVPYQIAARYFGGILWVVDDYRQRIAIAGTTFLKYLFFMIAANPT
ncbi:MAG: hypothetical protein WAK17_27510 [Candidatus Nitrosopolaris sp.]|jgi:hypothetical protein